MPVGGLVTRFAEVPFGSGGIRLAGSLVRVVERGRKEATDDDDDDDDPIALWAASIPNVWDVLDVYTTATMMWCIVAQLLSCLRPRPKRSSPLNDLDPGPPTDQAVLPSPFQQRRSSTKLEPGSFVSPDPPTRNEQRQVQKIVRAMSPCLLTLPRSTPLLHRRSTSSTSPTTGMYHRRALLASAFHSPASQAPTSRRGSSQSVAVATLAGVGTTVGVKMGEGVVPVRPLALGSGLQVVTDPCTLRNCSRSMKHSPSSSSSGQHDASMVRRSSEPVVANGSTTSVSSTPRPSSRTRSSTSPIVPRLSTIVAESAKESQCLVREQTWVE